MSEKTLLETLIGDAPALIDHESAVKEVIQSPAVTETHQLQALKLIQDASSYGGLTISFGADGSWVAVCPYESGFEPKFGSTHKQLLGFLKKRAARKR